MIGSIIGDIAGSTYEFEGNKDPTVPLFPDESDYTDDTILTVATAKALLCATDYRMEYLDFGRRYSTPKGGYGSGFSTWLREGALRPYGSWGNGAAMRVGPIGWAFESLEETLAEAKKSAVVSHSHPEGVKGAQATVTAIWMARNGKQKEEIRNAISRSFDYDLSRSVAHIRQDYAFNESCQRSVPEAIIAFLDSKDFESSIRTAISLGGDADTVGCITGSIAQAYYRDIPIQFQMAARALVPFEFADIEKQFAKKYNTE